MPALPDPAGNDPLGLTPADAEVIHERVGRLERILAFCGHDLHDVLTNPVARRRVDFYLAVDREVTRRGEIGDLERQWNPLGRMA